MDGVGDLLKDPGVDMAQGTGTGDAGGSDVSARDTQYELQDLELSGEQAGDVTGGYSWEEFKADALEWSSSACCSSTG